MLIFIVAYIKDTGEMLTELTIIEWSFEVRRDNFWSFDLDDNDCIFFVRAVC